MRNHLYVLGAGLYLFISSIGLANSPRDLVTDAKAKNNLLLVGVSGGLPGIDKDLKMVEEIGQNPNYQFVPTKLWSSQGTVANTSQQLTQLATDSGENGTLFFYYSGHGSPGKISLRDRSMRISEIRKAVEVGREAIGPISRLVMMFDSCYSGSLVDPLRKVFNPLIEQSESESFADEVVREFSQNSDRRNYWKSIFVFASSRASETSNAGSNGSNFTVALKKAFNEVLSANGTMSEWVQKTKTYTKGHRPVERFAPVDVANEKLVP